MANSVVVTIPNFEMLEKFQDPKLVRLPAIYAEMNSIYSPHYTESKHLFLCHFLPTGLFMCGVLNPAKIHDAFLCWLSDTTTYPYLEHAFRELDSTLPRFSSSYQRALLRWCFLVSCVTGNKEMQISALGLDHFQEGAKC
jgi:hypothetical protein